MGKPIRLPGGKLTARAARRRILFMTDLDQRGVPNEPDTQLADAEELLLAFVRSRDVECPRCGYNLRALTQPRCPECREALSLQVGVAKVRIGWFVATIIPGAFSGICALILSMPMALVPLLGWGPPPPIQFVLLDAFGWLSGLVAVAIYSARQRFVRAPGRTQATWAIALWTVHLAAFAIVVVATL